MSMKTLFTVLGMSFVLTTTVVSPVAMANLVNKAQQEQQQEQKHQQQREQSFQQTEQQLLAEKKALIAQRNALQAKADQLAQQFSENENQLAHLEEKLTLETGSLGEIFGVVRQNAKEIKADLVNLVTQVDRQHYRQVIDDIVEAKSLPSMTQLSGLWQALLEQIQASGEVSVQNVTFIDENGRQQIVPAVRIGSLGLVAEQGYVRWNGQRQDAVAYLKQPESAPTLASLQAIVDGKMQTLVLDPTKGFLIEQLATAPSLQDRIEQGGIVGYVILVLLSIGLIIAFYRGAVLLLLQQKIKRQLKQPQTPGNNPLGRILSVYDQEQNRSVEALELRLLEAAVDEQSGLEKGLSMLKLLAALAPMLGLLGTVTGMIETFQVITQFGNGDPKVMAGGISMALVTTVQGLVTAIPLLLAHNLLSSQVENIRNILEKQGIALVAQEAERACGFSTDPALATAEAK